MFELELSAKKISAQLDLPYYKIHRAMMVIRCAILAHAPDAEAILHSGEIELDDF
ncbi:MAG: hypothetical protein Q4C70_10745 [Planctomycetia bacterium]|nr:hypothetical protein [Planctomycetia bacterium]